MIQVRERQLDDRSLLDFVREVVEAARGTDCAVIVNDRPDLALAAGADGVHLKADGVLGADICSLTDKRLLIGRSVHSVGDAVAAEKHGGYDYLLFGTVFPSSSKPTGHTIAGVSGLHDVCRSVLLPVLAIGGITPARARELAAAGASGVAAISFFGEAPDMAEAVRALQGSLTPHSGRV
jgi:thiamine-phosphate pyrophosphorylase